jgi:hypothetical protein
METFFRIWQPRVLGVAGIAAALRFVQHGAAKLLGFPYVPSFAELKIFLLLGLVGVLELVGGGSMNVRKEDSVMSICRGEAALMETLSDPVTLAVMAADGVEPGEVEALMRRVSRRIDPARACAESDVAGMPA